MKKKGEFETAKQMYRRALEMDRKNPYANQELIKLIAITEEKMAANLNELILEISERRIRKKCRDCTCCLY